VTDTAEVLQLSNQLQQLNAAFNELRAKVGGFFLDDDNNNNYYYYYYYYYYYCEDNDDNINIMGAIQSWGTGGQCSKI